MVTERCKFRFDHIFSSSFCWPKYQSDCLLHQLIRSCLIDLLWNILQQMNWFSELLLVVSAHKYLHFVEKEEDKTNPKVYVVYCGDQKSHCDNVKRFVRKLVSLGINATCDMFDDMGSQSDQGFYITTSLMKADKVLIVCSELLYNGWIAALNKSADLESGKKALVNLKNHPTNIVFSSVCTLTQEIKIMPFYFFNPLTTNLSIIYKLIFAEQINWLVSIWWEHWSLEGWASNLCCHSLVLAGTKWF